jgi:ureidoglycolate hydrolase
VQAVVVRQGERAVALLGGRPGQLDRVRSSVQEGVGGVTVELDIWHEQMFPLGADG